MKNFWQKLKKLSRQGSGRAIYVLAPMAGVADSAFRQIAKQFGADVVYSEMVSATALAYNSKKTLALMKFNKKERPYVIQLFGSKPEHFAKAAKIIENKIKPDGIDINFGCPVKKVARQGAGAVLMNNFKLAREIIEATINNTKLPVSIKIRSCVGSTKALDFLKNMVDLDIKAVMIHGRSMAQGQSGEVDWKIIKQARPFVKGILLANGGVKNAEDASELLRKTGADGIGIGQGALGKPWIFSQLVRHGKPKAKRATYNSQLISKKMIFQTALKHAKLAEKLKGQSGIIEMRKHLCWYVSGLPDASVLRGKFIKAESLNDIKKILR
ncbi:MAG: tRNA-dihydrouridine synthase family protein [bacterium]|nr:tRNA-dihydrouridine synthase family protein [bacterium]